MHLPLEFMEQMKRELGDEAPAFFSSYDEAGWVGLRANTQKGYAPDGFARVPWCANGYYVPSGLRMGKDPLHAAGAYYLQEPSAMAPVEALGVQPGMRVLDLCAAPGGKSTQIADHLGGKGIIIANEIHPTRARILLENIERMGVRNAAVLNETPARIAAHFGAWFDAVLVDAPCSGEGMFRRDPQAVEQWNADAPLMCHHRQMDILSSAAKCLRGGGVLVYSTCTYNQTENENTVAAFLEAHPQFDLDGGFLLEGIDCANGMAHLYPHRLRGEGHFVARLIKRANAQDHNELEEMPARTPDARFIKFAGEWLVDYQPHAVFAQGEWLYALPKGMPVLKGLKVLRAGVQVGKLATGRMQPAHALALSLGASGACQCHRVDRAGALRYLHGDTLDSDAQGFVLVTHLGLPLGWGKCSGGQLKNHLPKGLRWSI